MADLDDLPDLTDGATPITTGTAVNEAWWDLVQAALLGELRGATDPTRTPAQNTDEVLAARGVFASLLARLTDWEARQYVTPPQARNGFVLGNLLANDSFQMWSRGDALAPDFWTLSGAGAAIARCGSGLADTNVVTGQDHFSAKLTYGSAAAVLTQNAIESGLGVRAFGSDRYVPVDASGVSLPGYDSEDGALYAWLIGHVRSTAASRARLRIRTTSDYDSPYHPGDSTFKTLVAGPAQVFIPQNIQAQCRVEVAGDAHFQGLSLILAPAGLQPMYVPGRAVLKSFTFPLIATPAAATGYGYFVPSRPVHVLGVTAFAGTAPTGGTTLKLDLMTPISGGFVSLFSSLPTFVASDLYTTALADGTYRRRTIRGIYSAAAALADNSILRLDVNARDSGNTGANISVTVHYVDYLRPLDQFRATGNIGE